MTTLEEWEREDDSMAPALPELKAITRFLLGMGMELRTAGRLPHGPRALEGPRADAMFLRLRFLAMDVARADRNERTGALAADQIKETQQALADLRRPLDWLTKLANPLARGGMNMALEARRTKIERELAEIELADPHVRGEIEAALRAAGLQIDGGLAIAGAAESPADRRYRAMCLKRELAIVNLVAGLFLFGADDVLAVLDQAFAAGLANKLERQSDGRLKTGPEKLADRLTATAATFAP
jgi:hypothetical protein